MKIVVDTNIVFSALLNSNSKIAQILIYKNAKIQFYSCDYLQTEILRHRGKILEITKLTAADLATLEAYITQNITFINEHLLPKQLLDETHTLLKDIDLFDVPFVALTQHLDAKLWTGDKKLYTPLKLKNYQNIILTNELSELIDGLS